MDVLSAASVSSDLAYMGVAEALAHFRARTLSPVELLTAIVERASRIEPLINAFASQRLEAAFAQAKQAEITYQRDASLARALEGIPVALKNEHTLIGDRTTVGSSLLRDIVDSTNSPITQRLLDAGAVIHAKTNVPEFCCAMFTRSREHGVTRNPWLPRVSCGGSSGGSAAALSAGLTTLASGSDIGGSIRIPASLCGIAGFKPSYGRVPEGLYEYAMHTYNHNGPMGRSVADCALMFNVINGAHRDDPATVAPPLQISTRWPSLKGLTVALSMDLGYLSVHPDVVRNTAAVATALRDCGATVNEVSLEWDHSVRDSAACGLLFGMGRMLDRIVAGRCESVNDYTLDMIDAGSRVTSEAYLEHYSTMGRMDRALQDVLADHAVLLCPTLAITEIPAEGGRKPLDDLWKGTMTYPFNMLSRHPVLAVPSGLASNGVPTGVQIVGRRFEDDRVLQVGGKLEEVLQWSRRRPPCP